MTIQAQLGHTAALLLVSGGCSVWCARDGHLIEMDNPRTQGAMALLHQRVSHHGRCARLDVALDRFDKVVAVRLRVKPENVGAQHAIEQLFTLRTDAEAFGRGPRNVPAT